MTLNNPTRLEYALLGLILQGTKSGYELRKEFAQTPMGVFSDSPGSIYPALARMKRRGWIRRHEGASGPRRREVLGVTRAGNVAFRKWATPLPTRGEIVRHLDDALLRFAFMGLVAGRGQVRAFLKAFQRQITAYVGELRLFLKAMPEAKIPTGRLALENGIMEYEAQARWARRALASLRRSP